LQAGAISGAPDANPGILDLSPTIRLEHGRRYALKIAFNHDNLSGILQFVGHAVYREYGLPLSGEKEAFGDRPGGNHVVDLWTSDPAGDDVTIRFIPADPRTQVSTLANFGSFALFPAPANPAVVSLLPLTMEVTSDQPAFLETPRMFTPTYWATVDGRRVASLRSAAGLVMVPIPAGKSSVQLQFRAPLLLGLSYWMALGFWVATLVAYPLRARVKN
jgi:hypothetical protein